MKYNFNSSCDIKYYEGPQNLNWPRIMQKIQEDPKKFHTEEGGWSFLNVESDSEEEKKEESSEFEPEEESLGSDESEEVLKLLIFFFNNYFYFYY